MKKRIKVEEIVRKISFIEVEEKDICETKLNYGNVNNQIIDLKDGCCITVTRKVDDEIVYKNTNIIRPVTEENKKCIGCTYFSKNNCTRVGEIGVNEGIKGICINEYICTGCSIFKDGKCSDPTKITHCWKGDSKKGVYNEG